MDEFKERPQVKESRQPLEVENGKETIFLHSIPKELALNTLSLSD
jgi:hypothetical protein